MKTLATRVLLGGAGLFGSLMLTGCMGDTPAYSSDERGAQIARNWDFEWQQLADDTDHALLLRPSSTLTQWNVWHRE